MFELLLEGRSTGKPEGVIKLEVSIKKISNRNMISVMDDMLKVASILLLDFKAMVIVLSGNYRGSCNRSIKSMELYSILWTTFCTCATR